MGNVKQVSYQRVFNLGNYEAERIELVASVDADDSIKEVFTWLKAGVNYLHKLKKEEPECFGRMDCLVTGDCSKCDYTDGCWILSFQGIEAEEDVKK